MLVTKHRLLTEVELFYGEAMPPSLKFDRLRLTQWPHKMDDMVCQSYTTVHLKLQTDGQPRADEAILADFKKDTRYDVKRSTERDGLQHVVFDARNQDLREISVLAEFADYYNRFATTKGLVPIDMGRLQALNQNKELVISRIQTDAAEVLSWHSFHCTQQRARLMHSPLIRSQHPASGRANRFHHWCDLQFFRGQSVLIYDFGGFPTKVEFKEVSAFKTEFGGEVVEEFNCLREVTPLARMFGVARSVVNAARSARAPKVPTK